MTGMLSFLKLWNKLKKNRLKYQIMKTKNVLLTALLSIFLIFISSKSVV